MDPAESDKVRQALSSQGTRIGQHDAALQEFSEVLRGFSVGMTELGARMEQIGSQVSSLAAPGSIHGPAVSSTSDFHAAAHVASPSQLREPFIPTPVRYSGELGRCRQFLHQCTLVFEQQPLSYASDRTKTAFMMSLLRGLTDRIRDELAVRDETSSLDKLIALASRLDNRLRETEGETQSSRHSAHRCWFWIYRLAGRPV